MFLNLSDLLAEQEKERNRRRKSNAPYTGNRGKRRPKIQQGIIAIDGEGESRDNGEHNYTLLAASTGEYVRAARLTTQQCLDFLLSLDHSKLIVAFSMSYDVTKMLEDIPIERLKELHAGNWIHWKGYRICYKPRKELMVKRKGKLAHVWDVFGFYQTSFVRALLEWKVGTREQVQRISAMKDRRGNFAEEDDDKILEYCLEECRLLVQLVEELKRAVDDADLTLSRWDGAGAIATALLRREKVKQYMAPYPKEIDTAVMSAYFGGRTEIAYTGDLGRVYSYDINSAYPHVTRSLPCLQHLRYIAAKEYVPNALAIWNVRWDVSNQAKWGPFPFRIKDRILFPYSGEGWYHSSEVEAAIRMYPKGICILRGILLAPSCEHTPFAFVPQLYEYRKQLKAEGRRAELTVKLGLNSLYGKTAQSVGHSDKKPPYQSFLWAGMITAGCRAQVLDAILLNPSAIISVATDGILSTEPLALDCPEEKQLGKWESGTLRSIFLVQPGVYEGVRDDGVKVYKTRGFGQSETPFDPIREAYQYNPCFGEYKYTVTRFVPMGGALHLRDFGSKYGRWVNIDRHIKFAPTKRYIKGLPLEFAYPSIDDNGKIVDDFERVRQRDDFYVPNPLPLAPMKCPSWQAVSRPFIPRLRWDDEFSEWVVENNRALDHDIP